MSAATPPLQMAGPLLMRGLLGSLQGPLAPWGNLGLQTAGFLMRGAHPNVMAIGWGAQNFPWKNLALGLCPRGKERVHPFVSYSLNFFFIVLKYT